MNEENLRYMKSVYQRFPTLDMLLQHLDELQDQETDPERYAARRMLWVWLAGSITCPHVIPHIDWKEVSEMCQPINRNSLIHR